MRIMNRQATTFALIAVLLTDATASFSCMSIPTPAACTRKLPAQLKHQWDSQESELKSLVRRIRAEKRLYIDDVARVSTGRPGVVTNIDLIEDVKLRRQAMDRTPLAYARRLEALRDRLDSKQWEEAVRLWADYIARSEDLWEQTNAKEFCGLQEEGKSLALDAGYIFLWPFFFAELGKDSDPGQTAATSLVAGPVVTTVGVISLGADVLTFIPNVAVSAEKRLAANIHQKRSTHAFRKFARLVVKFEQSKA